MNGILEVSPSTLRACAGHGREIGNAITGLSNRATDACVMAAGPHSGWHFGAELSALAPRWQRQLSGQGSATSGDAANLSNSADTYTAAESANTDLARSMYLGAGTGVPWLT